MRGPKSRAGLMAYPVVPPKLRPMPQTRLPTRYGPKPAAGPPAATAFEKMAPATSTRMKLPMISLSRLAAGWRIAGDVQKQASLRSASGVSFQCRSHNRAQHLRRHILHDFAEVAGLHCHAQRHCRIQMSVAAAARNGGEHA